MYRTTSYTITESVGGNVPPEIHIRKRKKLYDMEGGLRKARWTRETNYIASAIKAPNYGQWVAHSWPGQRSIRVTSYVVEERFDGTNYIETRRFPVGAKIPGVDP